MARDYIEIKVPECLREGASLVVAEDVPNPAVDRRSKRDWRRAETVPAGTRITVEAYPEDREVIEGVEFVRRTFRLSHTAQTWSIHGTAVNGAFRFNRDTKDDSLFAALLPHLRERARTIDDIATQYGWSARAFLDALVKQGKVTVADIDEAVRLEMAEDE